MRVIGCSLLRDAAEGGQGYCHVRAGLYWDVEDGEGGQRYLGYGATVMNG